MKPNGRKWSDPLISVTSWIFLRFAVNSEKIMPDQVRGRILYANLSEPGAETKHYKVVQTKRKLLTGHTARNVHVSIYRFDI